MIEDPEELRKHFCDVSHENGPWTVNVWPPLAEGYPSRVVLQSDDFCHDTALIIDGDFYDFEQRMRYANRLAARMNLMPPEVKL